MADVIRVRTGVRSHWVRVVSKFNEKSLLRDSKNTEKKVTRRWRQRLK